jgi:hypothetical protein
LASTLSAVAGAKATAVMLVYAADETGGKMAYFLRRQTGIERFGKMAADIFCFLIVLTFLVAFFGALGMLAAIVVCGAIVSLDYVMPNEDDAAGAAIR